MTENAIIFLSCVVGAVTVFALILAYVSIITNDKNRRGQI